MNAEIKWERGFRVGRFIVRLIKWDPKGLTLSLDVR
jgi:hypothetical protein